MLLLVAGITFASMVLVGQPALANEVIVVVDLDKSWCDGFIIRVRREAGIQILRIFSIPKSKLTREPGVVVCDYNISLKKYALYELWDIRHFSFLCCSSFIFVLHCVQGTILFPKSKACSAHC